MSEEVCCEFVMLDLAQQMLNNIGVEVAIKLIAQSMKQVPVAIQSRELERTFCTLTETTTSASAVVYLTVNAFLNEVHCNNVSM